jgi:hypothetical protein
MSKIEKVLFIIFFGVFVFSIAMTNMKFDKRYQEDSKRFYSAELRLTMAEKQIPGIIKFQELVNILQDRSKNQLTAFEVIEIAKIIIVECEMNSSIDLTPDKILAVIERESNFNPKAISYAKAYGLMQVIRTTCELHLSALGYGDFSKDLVLDPIVNVQIGIKELIRLRKYWLEEGTDSWIVVMTSYFWGIRNTWSLLTEKRRANLPSLEYGKGILDLADSWKEKGI